MNGRFRLKAVGLNNIIVAHLLTIKYRTIHNSIDKVSEQDRKKFLEQIERSAKARGMASWDKAGENAMKEKV